MTPDLSHAHRKIYNQLFAHPMPQNLEWRDVLTLLSAFPGLTTTEDHDGNVKLTRNNQSLTLHRPKGKDFGDKSELSHLKHFLSQPETTPQPTAPGTHLLVVIDHHEARIFTAEMRGSTPEQIKPYDPFGFARAQRDSADDGTGKRTPEQKSFYESIAKTLQGAQQIILFGPATGSASAMTHLQKELQQNHPDIAKKIIATQTINEKHLTNDQLLAKARELFTSLANY